MSSYAFRNTDKRFHVHDAGVFIWREHLGDPAVKVDWWKNQDWDTHEAVRMTLVRSGFTFRQDPHMLKHYRSLAKCSHIGWKQDVHFKSRISGRTIEIKFYEDVVRDHPSGGFYTYDKLSKMPYQRRKKTELAIRKIVATLLSLGFVDASDVKPELAIDRCMQQREELGLFQGEKFYCNPPGPYNSKDADGNELKDGQTRYFWDYHGRLGRGEILHNINNMWWVISSPYTLLNIANFYFFDWHPGMPTKNPLRRELQLKKAMASAIETSDYEKAAILRDVLGIERGASLKEAA